MFTPRTRRQLAEERELLERRIARMEFFVRVPGKHPVTDALALEMLDVLRAEMAELDAAQAEVAP